MKKRTTRHTLFYLNCVQATRAAAVGIWMDEQVTAFAIRVKMALYPTIIIAALVFLVYEESYRTLQTNYVGFYVSSVMCVLFV